MHGETALTHLAHEIIEEFWNKKRLELADRFVTPDYVIHGPQGMLYRGVDGLKQHASAVFTAIPDVHFAIEDLVCAGDRIVMRWSFKGTQKGDFHGIKASGMPVMVFGASVSLVRHGRLAETWGYWDVLDFMHQMGAALEVKVDTRA